MAKSYELETRAVCRRPTRPAPKTTRRWAGANWPAGGMPRKNLPGSSWIINNSRKNLSLIDYRWWVAWSSCRCDNSSTASKLTYWPPDVRNGCYEKIPLSTARMTHFIRNDLQYERKCEKNTVFAGIISEKYGWVFGRGKFSPKCRYNPGNRFSWTFRDDKQRWLYQSQKERFNKPFSRKSSLT